MEKHIVYTAIVKANAQANTELFRHQESVLKESRAERSAKNEPLKVPIAKRAPRASK